MAPRCRRNVGLFFVSFCLYMWTCMYVTEWVATMLFLLKGSPSLELLTLRYKCHFEIKKPRSARITIKFSPWFSCVYCAGIASPSLHLTTRFLEQFLNDCRKTKTKAITPTNHDWGKQRDEPITIPSNDLKLAQSAGKITRTWRDWFWFCFSLAERLARLFSANHYA